MMTRDSNATSTEIRKVVGLVVGLTILLAVMLCAFALPAVHTGAHGVPVGVVGNDQVVATVSEKLDGFEVSAYPDADAAGAAILDRQIYGAFVVESGQVHTLWRRQRVPRLPQPSLRRVPVWLQRNIFRRGSPTCAASAPTTRAAPDWWPVLSRWHWVVGSPRW